MDETNLDWDNLRLFLSVARNGGLSAAAEASGKSAPTLGRRMLNLERQLGQELFQRLPRGYVLTENGELLLKLATKIQNSITPLVKVNDSTIRRVKISAGTWTTFWLCQHLQNLVENEHVILQFTTADHDLDIPHREAVIGIRNRRPTQPNLAGRRVNTVQFATYALNTETNIWASPTGNTPSAKWVRNNAQTERCVEISSPRNALDLTLAGVTKLVLPTFIGRSIHQLKQVSDEIPELKHSQWLVSHHDDRHLPEVRVVIDSLYSLLSTNDE